jgi:hypothetical protein
LSLKAILRFNFAWNTILFKDIVVILYAVKWLLQ